MILLLTYINRLTEHTVKLRIEAPGFYQYKSVRPPACMRGPASTRGPACIITCQLSLCYITFFNLPRPASATAAATTTATTATA